MPTNRPTNPSRSTRAAALRLARLHNIQPSYHSAFGQRVSASTDALLAALATLGVDARPSRLAAGERQRINQLRAQVTPLAAPAWNGKATLELRLPKRTPAAIECALTLESGEVRAWSVRTADLKSRSRKGPGGEPETITRLPIADLPHGYHVLTTTIARTEHTTFLISAPVRSHKHSRQNCDHEWGLFCPLYALRSERTLGCGDLTDLRNLAHWQATLGGRVVATLPMLAVYLDEPFDPSPYAPVSRLFWNELFIDPTAPPDFAKCTRARTRLRSPAFRRELESLNGAALVQYRREAALRRSLLEPLAERFFARHQENSGEYQAFLARNPLARDYTRFRAVMERQRVDWSDWSQRLREGRFGPNDYDPSHERFHLYAQFLFEQQFGALAADMRERHGLVYLDLPVGVRRDGFDVFKYPELFATTASVGAPPDPFFTSGQDWGFPPVLPDAQRAHHYEYLIASLRNHMRFADQLRLDHVMAFHRLFIIPDAMETRDGVYLHYDHEEAFAILSLESHRNRCRLVGENLGTVPPMVNKALAAHEMAPLYVAQYEVQPRPAAALRPVTPRAVASSNTHDMPPLATWWSGADVSDRINLGIFDAALEKREKAHRAKLRKALLAYLKRKHELRGDDLEDVRDAIHAHLADSEADLVLLNIEDLWLEHHWQNVPGTLDIYPNWRHKLRYSLEQIAEDPDIARQLETINTLRKHHRHATTASD